MSEPNAHTLADGSRHLPAGQSFDPGADGARTLPVVWRRHWASAPTRPQLHDPTRGWLTRGDLAAETARAAGRLATAGLRAGDRVLLSAQSSAAFVIAHVACLRLGATVVPTNTAYRQAEIAHLVADARPRLAIVDSDQRAGWIRAIDPSVQVTDPGLPLDDGPTPPLDQMAPECPALLAYTSGTTGRSKGAVLTHANLLAGCESLRLAWRWSPDDRLLLALPLFHIHGLGVGLHGTLHAGASVVLMPRFDPDELTAAVGRHQASLFFGVPTLYHRLADHPRVAELAQLRLCVSGSAPLSAALHERIETASGQRILERYGMTETTMLVSNPVEGERRPGSVGLPLPGVDVRLAGDPAEIQVRGPNVFSGYWQRPEADAEAFTADGWFRTGDLGVALPDGYLRIEGRAKELVISGGYNVYPREVEDALRSDPKIEDAAVVGEPCEEWGERVVAYVVATGPVTLPALRERLDQEVAAYKHPRTLYRVAELPRNALGKVQKHRLRAGRVLPESPACSASSRPT